MSFAGIVTGEETYVFRHSQMGTSWFKTGHSGDGPNVVKCTENLQGTSYTVLHSLAVQQIEVKGLRD